MQPVIIDQNTRLSLGLPPKHIAGTKFSLPINKFRLLFQFDPEEEKLLTSAPLTITLTALTADSHYDVRAFGDPSNDSAPSSPINDETLQREKNSGFHLSLNSSTTPTNSNKSPIKGSPLLPSGPLSVPVPVPGSSVGLASDSVNLPSDLEHLRSNQIIKEEINNDTPIPLPFNYNKHSNEDIHSNTFNSFHHSNNNNNNPSVVGNGEYHRYLNSYGGSGGNNHNNGLNYLSRPHSPNSSHSHTPNHPMNSYANNIIHSPNTNYMLPVHHNIDNNNNDNHKKRKNHMDYSTMNNFNHPGYVNMHTQNNLNNPLNHYDLDSFGHLHGSPSMIPPPSAGPPGLHLPYNIIPNHNHPLIHANSMNNDLNLHHGNEVPETEFSELNNNNLNMENHNGFKKVIKGSLPIKATSPNLPIKNMTSNNKAQVNSKKTKYEESSSGSGSESDEGLGTAGAGAGTSGATRNMSLSEAHAKKKGLKKKYKQRYQQKKSIKKKLTRFHETTGDSAIVIFVTNHSQRKFGCDIDFFNPDPSADCFFNCFWRDHQELLLKYIHTAQNNGTTIFNANHQGSNTAASVSHGNSGPGVNGPNSISPNSTNPVLSVPIPGPPGPVPLPGPGAGAGSGPLGSMSMSNGGVIGTSFHQHETGQRHPYQGQ